MTKYKYFHFAEVEMPLLNRKLKTYICKNNRTGDILGEVEFYDPWRQWVIEFRPGCVFNNQCLRDINDFLTKLNQHKI